MNKLFLLTICLLNISLIQVKSQSIDASSSKITFEISNMKVNTVNGSVGKLQGDVAFDEDDLSLCQFNVCVDANTIDTGMNKRDEHLMKEDFFDVVKFPSICFESEQTEKTGNSYLAKGLLKMRGVEKSVEISFEKKDNALVGELDIKRTDFGIGGKGTFMVGDDVKIYIHCALE